MREELIKHREMTGMSQEEVADILGISRSYYGHIETGNRNPTYGLARKISELFNTSAEALFFDLDGFRMKPNNQNTG